MEKIALKDVFNTLLSERVHSTQLSDFVKETYGDQLTHAEMVAIGQILKAVNERDTQAAVFIRDTMGQKPGTENKLMGTKDNPFVINLGEDLDKWAE